VFNSRIVCNESKSALIDVYVGNKEGSIWL